MGGRESEPPQTGRGPDARTLLLVVAVGAGCGEAAPDRVYDGEGSLLAPQAAVLREHNVLLISIDTLRADHLGCYGYARPTSPGLDALARESVVFEQAISCSPWTTPAHLSLMTSLYPTVHGILGYPYPGTLDPAAVTLAEILRSQGWRTAGFAEGGYAKGATGLDHGFQTFPDWPGDEASYISHELAPTRLAENARRASEWLDENAGGRFFLFFHTYEPHFEYHPPREALAAIAPEIDVEAERRALRTAVASWNARRRLSLEEKGLLHRHYLQGDLRSFALERPKRFWPMLQRFIDDQWQDSPNFAADLAYVTALYDAEIRFTDEVVSRLVAKLAELGLLERTLVVVTSDHGEGLMDHGFVQHGKNLYDELLRVPLIIRFPDGLGAGTRYGAQVRSLDILPTVLDWVGLPVPVAAQGESLLPLVRGEPAERLSYAEGVTFAGDERSIVMLRNERWKYVRHPFADREELYDLTADGAERVDLADGSAEILRGLRARLDQITAMNAARAQEYSVVPSTFTARERQRLEALGYAGGENE